MTIQTSFSYIITSGDLERKLAIKGEAILELDYKPPKYVLVMDETHKNMLPARVEVLEVKNGKFICKFTVLYHEIGRVFR